MVITHFVLAGRGITGLMGGASVVVALILSELFVTPTTGLVRVVWISALLARAVLSFSLICSICSWGSCSSPGWGGAKMGGAWATSTAGGVAIFGWADKRDDDEDAEGKESTKLASEAVGPRFSHILLFGMLGLAGLVDLAPPSLVSEVASRASSWRVLRVSRLKWTRLKSRLSLATAAAVTLSAASLLLSLFHFAEAPGAGGAGKLRGGWNFCMLQLSTERHVKV